MLVDEEGNHEEVPDLAHVVEVVDVLYEVALSHTLVENDRLFLLDSDASESDVRWEPDHILLFELDPPQVRSRLQLVQLLGLFLKEEDAYFLESKALGQVVVELIVQVLMAPLSQEDLGGIQNVNNPHLLLVHLVLKVVPLQLIDESQHDKLDLVSMVSDHRRLVLYLVFGERGSE